jgi:hypothetical protein
MYLQKVIRKKIEKIFFVGILKVTDKKSRIWIRIRTKMSRIPFPTKQQSFALGYRYIFYKNVLVARSLVVCTKISRIRNTDICKRKLKGYSIGTTHTVKTLT